MSPYPERDPEHKILLLMSGSIACAKASALISAWVKQGHQVKVACTASVKEFVGRATLEGFSGHPVLDNAFAPGQVMDHIHHARWADIVVAAPATSNLINKFAAGIADDVVTSLWQAAYGHNKPLFIVPAMNTHMWNYPATQESIRRLQSWGISVLATAEGDLACGEFGAGRMLEPEIILQTIATAINESAPGNDAAEVAATGAKRILITAGGTREPIDSVRYIGNISSGGTAARLTESLIRMGHELTWLGAESAQRPALPCRMDTFVSFEDLQNKLQLLLGQQPYDMIIHASAVSDFSVDRIEQDGDNPSAGAHTKLSSSSGLTLHLKRNPKLIEQLRGWSANPAIRVIAFKLTHGAGPAERSQAVNRLFSAAQVDAVVHNDLDEITAGQHPFTWYRPASDGLRCEGQQALAHQLGDLMS